jgi:uncharacterized C2H2 Zn-finger protein
MSLCGTDPRKEQKPDKSRWNTTDGLEPVPCERCGRMLKAKQSIIRRVGAVCFKKSQMAARG